MFMTCAQNIPGPIWKQRAPVYPQAPSARLPSAAQRDHSIPANYLFDHRGKFRMHHALLTVLQSCNGRRQIAATGEIAIDAALLIILHCQCQK
jgi:hypothetical protein